MHAESPSITNLPPPPPPPPRARSAHQYDYDAQTVMGFLQTYGLAQDFKINIEPNHTTLAGHAPEHDILAAARYGMLGSIDANTGGWVWWVGRIGVVFRFVFMLTDQLADRLAE